MIEQTIPNDLRELAEIQAQHEDELLAKQNVVGVALGNKITDKKGDTGEPAVTVLVESKLHEDLLRDEDIVPDMIGGVKTDVQEVGVIQAGGPSATAYPELAMGELEIDIAPNGARHRGRRSTGDPRADRQARFEEELRALTLTLRSTAGDGRLQRRPLPHHGRDDRDGLLRLGRVPGRAEPLLPAQQQPRAGELEPGPHRRPDPAAGRIRRRDDAGGRDRPPARGSSRSASSRPHRRSR